RLFGHVWPLSPASRPDFAPIPGVFPSGRPVWCPEDFLLQNFGPNNCFNFNGLGASPRSEEWHAPIFSTRPPVNTARSTAALTDESSPGYLFGPGEKSR